MVSAVNVCHHGRSDALLASLVEPQLRKVASRRAFGAGESERGAIVLELYILPIAGCWGPDVWVALAQLSVYRTVACT